MEWQSKFTRTILIRGMDYFRRGKVVSLTRIDNCCTATVMGSRMYSVFVEEKNGKLAFARCDCPHSMSGYYCKHIAAVLFAIDEGEKREKSREAEISPFEEMTARDDGEGYRFFDMKRITRKLIIRTDTLQKAIYLADNNILSDFTMEEKYDGRYGSDGIVCEVRAHYVADYDCLIYAIFDEDGILDTFCNKYDHINGFKGGCLQGERFEPNEYILALLLMAGRKIRDGMAGGDSTSGIAMKLLSSFRSERKDVPAQIRRSVRIEPRLVFEDGRYFMTVKAGTDKLYVIRNIEGFVRCAEDKKVYSQGGFSVDFTHASVDPDDMGIYGLLRDCVNDTLYRDNAGNSPDRGFLQGSSGKNRAELYGSRFDRFYDLIDGRKLSVTLTGHGSKRSTAVRTQSCAPEIRIDIKKDLNESGIFHGISVNGKAPVFLSGAAHRYFIDGGNLCRVPPEYDKQLAPLYQLFAGGDFSFRVGRNNLAEFYRVVMPRLRSVAEVREYDGDYIEKYLPPDAEMVFYLDSVGKALTCKAAARYGETEYPLADSVAAHSAGFRDVSAEGAALETVKEYFPLPDAAGDTFACENDDDAAYRVLSEGVGRLLELGEVNCTDRFRALGIRRKIPVKVGVSLSGNMMDLSIESTDVPMKELAEILRSYRQKKKYHRLKNGDFVDMDETVSELSDMLDTMRLSMSDLAQGSMTIPAYRALYLDRMSEKCDALSIRRDAAFKRIIKEFKTVSDSDFDVPEHLQPVMRSYQVYGHRWLRTLEKYGFGGILADDMGLGKTLEVISVLSSAKSEGQRGTSLVVCPASLIYNWLEEIRRFAPELQAVAVAGSQPERAEIIRNIAKFDVAVTSYDLIKRDIAAYTVMNFNYEIIDEAQYIKNHSTAAAKAVKAIEARVRYALTGTPIENRLSELWSIFDYLMPGFLYGYDTFRGDFEIPITREKDDYAIQKLRRMTAPFILRRLKSDVLKDLPDKIEEVRYAAFDTHQRQLYDAQVLSMKGMLERSDQETVRRSKIQILAELMKIRQICCDPSLVFEDYTGGSAKRSACVELIRSAIEGEHKILVFSQFRTMLQLLETDLQREGITCYRIFGDTPKQVRTELVQKFNSDDTPVFLISLKAGGTGLNLTGADVVIHYDPWWNIAAQNQATDRAHRIGQTRIVSVYKLIAKNTVEERILELQQSKKALADEILSGELGNIGSLSREELLSLFD